MLRFKVGDVVEVFRIITDDMTHDYIGKVGTIIALSPNCEHDYSVQFGDDDNYFFEAELELVNNPNQVKIVQVDKTMDLPKYQTKGSSGMDLMARCFCYTNDLKTELESDKIFLYPNKRLLIKTGIKIKMPTGLEAQVRCRSGLALKNGIMVVNGVGTIDEDFTGEIGVILYNSGDVPFLIQKGDRIAQLVFQKVEQYIWDVVDTLAETERSDGGYGHTGVQSNV